MVDNILLYTLHIHEGRFLTYGYVCHLSTNCDIFSVYAWSQLETMGQIPIGFLWIFFMEV